MMKANRNECMDRIEELCHNNPNWAAHTNLNSLSWGDMGDTMKVLCYKRCPKSKGMDEQTKKNLFLAESKTFIGLIF